MNALARTALARSALTRVPRSPAVQQQRTKAATAFEKSLGSYKDFDYAVWSSEAGAYPLILILGVAIVGCAGYYSYNVAYNPDIRVTPSKRHALIRTWQ
mmetsp:Transcript_44969/g.66757  ORF Transcript_44969/g.66757 Transcript_44969/m.66757 type:complete len:99 (-) Transcript_44969:128-424(-)